MFGVKIYIDADKELVKEVVNFAADSNLSIEFQMLRRDDKKILSLEYLNELLEGTNFPDIKDVTLHLSHYKTLGAKINDTEVMESFNNELTNANKLGAKRVIMHYSDISTKEEITDKKLYSDLSEINKLGAKFKLSIHIENTLFIDAHGNDVKVDVDFYKKMFIYVVENKLSNIGFCLDLGHAKCFSDCNLAEWVELLDYLKSKNVPLYFHLHNNDRTDDAHMAFHIAEEKGLNKGDEFSAGIPYIEVIRKLHDDYKSPCLLEVYPTRSIAEVNWINDNL